MSKYGDLIQKARDENEEQSRNTENQKAGKPEREREVNLGIKVAESRRRHWVAEAKRAGTSVTAVILEALSKRFGEPNDR